MRVFTSIISVWIAAAGVVVARGWWRVYVDEIYNEKMGKAWTFALTWEPMLYVVMFATASWIVVRWLMRRRRFIERMPNGVLYGVVSLGVWWAIAWCLNRIFMPIGPVDLELYSYFALIALSFPLAQTIALLAVGKEPNQALQTTSVARSGFGKVSVSDRQRRGV